jgi:hypothetical protein
MGTQSIRHFCIIYYHSLIFIFKIEGLYHVMYIVRANDCLCFIIPLCQFIYVYTHLLLFFVQVCYFKKKLG